MSKGTELRPSRRMQGGYALLVTVLMLVLFSVAFLLPNREPGRAQATRDLAEKAENLQDAKGALLVYATIGGVDGDAATGRPGTLPCPDMSTPDDSGSGYMSITDCGSKPELGRFPVKTLRLSFDRPIPWFAMDANFLNDGTEPINPDQTPALSGQLELDGDPGYAAILIAPGTPLNGQDRNIDEAASFLERSNAFSGDHPKGENFDSCKSTTADPEADDEPCNDYVVTITAEEVMNTARRRVLAELESILVEHYENDPGNQTLPYPASPGSAPEQECDPKLETGMLPLTEPTGGCKGNGHLDVCGMARWIRPLDIEEFDCDAAIEAGNDWLRFIRYEIDSSCAVPSGGCVATVTSDNEDIYREITFE